jgi:hypothetical protein
MTPPSFDRKRGDEMGGRKAAGIVLLVVGILVLFLSLFADLVGLWGGAVMTVVGLDLILRNGLLALTSTWTAAICGGVRADEQGRAEETIAVGGFPFGPPVS